MINFHSSERHVSGTSGRRQPAPHRPSRVVAMLLASVAAFAFMSIGAQQASAAETQQVDKVLQAQAAVDAAAAKSQKRINELTDRTQTAAAKYAQVLAEAKSFERYNQQLSQQVQAQHTEIASLQRQLKAVVSTAREIQPLMDKMVDSLSKFVALDLPFLPQERVQRIQRLRDIMSRVDVTIAEKYRQILQAYMIELGYGHTLGAYKGVLGEGKDARTVQFVRVGRVTLMYQTLDGSQTGYWNAEKHKWVIDDGYAAAFKTALDMANQRGTPQLLTVPVPVPQEAKP